MVCYAFLHSFLSFFLHSFLSFFLHSFPSFLPFFLPSFLSSFLHFFLSSFLPSYVIYCVYGVHYWSICIFHKYGTAQIIITCIFKSISVIELGSLPYNNLDLFLYLLKPLPLSLPYPFHSISLLSFTLSFMKLWSNVHSFQILSSSRKQYNKSFYFFYWFPTRIYDNIHPIHCLIISSYLSPSLTFIHHNICFRFNVILL